MREINMPPFRMVIYMHRCELEMSREQYAAKYGVTRQTISNWEIGATEPSGQALHDAVQDYLRMPLHEWPGSSEKKLLAQMDREIKQEDHGKK